jgi:hypothetical protein
MLSKLPVWAAISLTSCVSFFCLQSFATANAGGPDVEEPEALADSMIAIDEFSKVGEDRVVTFDDAAAKASGMSAKDRRLGREMAAFSNAVTTASKSAEGLTGARRALKRLPAARRSLGRIKAKFRPSTKGTPLARASFGDNPYTYTTCGSFWSPRPTTGHWWVTHWTNNPSGTLWAWGYHPTPGLIGGGWTRPITHAPWVCGWSTFRDHAYIPAWNQIREQNYNGWWPRGEPNPEVYRSGPWPYATWPAYVYWWHQRY